MTNSKKFNLIIFLFVISSTFFTYNAAVGSISDGIPAIPRDYEQAYSNTVCDGDNNIVKAGCAVISGQIVRGIPAMLFGASFDKVGECVRKAEEWTSGSTINTNDTCNQIGLMNPAVDKSQFVLDSNSPSSDASVNGLVVSLHQMNDDIASKSFDNTYFVYKSVENIPVAREAFAQGLNVTSIARDNVALAGLGEPLLSITYNSWLVFRNVAYAIIGLLSIVLGLTLMSSNSFLDNNAKWRLSLEQALPRVIIAVILIQFSYIIGEVLLFTANNENFVPIFNYMFNIDDYTGFSKGFLLAILGLIFSIFNWLNLLTGFGLPLFMLIGLVGLGIWYLYRLVIVWWQSLQAVIGICIMTIASPILIALSLLPGEAGALQLRRYFASLVSLTAQTFLYQLIKAGPGIFTALLYNFFLGNAAVVGENFFRAVAVPGYAAFVGLMPLVIAIIILQYSDGVQNMANQFAKNLTGADPLGAQQQGK